MNQKFSSFISKTKAFFLFPYLPFVIYGIVMLSLHILIELGWGDDAAFVSYLQDSFDFATLVDVLKFRYQTWSSRLLIEGVLFMIVHAPMLWRILDTLIMVWIAVAFSLFFNPKRRTDLNWMIVLTVLSFPFLSMSTAGWIATTLNYSWPFAFGLFALLPLVRQVQGKKTSPVLYILSIPALLFAANQEQMCAVMLAISGLLTLYLWVKRKKAPWFAILQTVISFASLIFILTCPGNSVRTTEEILDWFPQFAHLSLLRKIELGYSSSMNHIMMQPSLVFTLFCVFLLMAVFANSTKTLPRILASVPLAASLLFGFLSPVTSLFFPDLLSICGQMSDIGSGIQLASPLTWIPDIVFTVTLLCVLISLLYAFQKKELALLSCFLILLGLASRVVMGFSPTIWASASRTFTFMFFAFIAVSILLFSSLKNDFPNGKTLTKLPLWGIGIYTVFVAEELLHCLL